MHRNVELALAAAGADRSARLRVLPDAVTTAAAAAAALGVEVGQIKISHPRRRLRVSALLVGQSGRRRGGSAREEGQELLRVAR